ncbi:ABC transporter permease [Dietzia sp. ANT_WB102]|uniref:ABC transporter permease n=1 Tax=Dietzia sp. ANT_WB102 TaxID=2597345 RepID=UPI0011EBE486|nr:ABC transporter permease [Dietzia sp. ANT_WB102]KAA0918974.1 ABC transporter permease [Dietzia sp. ANT_WB102]
MLRFIGERALHAVIVVVLAAVGAFFLMEAVPGDAAGSAVGSGATAEQYQQAREELGLDDPVMVRFSEWAGGIVRGDLGNSLIPPNQPVVEMIGNALPVTMQLAFLAIVLSLATAVPVAVWSAYRRGSVFDQVSSVVAFAFISVPSFVGGLLLIYLFVFNHSLAQQLILGAAVIIGLLVALSPIGRRGGRREPGVMWGRAMLGGLVVGGVLALVALFLPEFPRQGYAPLADGLGENLRSIALPAITLALMEVAIFTRVLRTDMISTLQQDFVLSSRAKGMPTGHVLVAEALRPSTVSVITLAGISLGRLIGGTVVVERLFNLPGMGSMIVDAVQNDNLPVVLGGVIVIAVFYVLVNMAVDVTYALIDPRIRRG